MEKYISDWLRIIDEMKNDTTYKTAWGRAVIECVYLDEFVIENGNKAIINQSDIVKKMIKYYWNQTFFFSLSQGKSPYILKIVKIMIEEYVENVTNYPTTWDKAEVYFKQEEKQYNRCISKILSNTRVNVCPRFKNVCGETLEIYDINDKDKTLIFNKYNIDSIKEYAFVLSKLLNFKWAQLLERFNTVPKINKKISDSTERKIRRTSLAKYKKLLLEYYHGDSLRDFYTGELLDKDNIHIDHVIPWSYIYSDDLWNLVITSPKTNLSKSNKAPNKEYIEKLKGRNNQLISLIKEKDSKFKNSIKNAIEDKTLDKLYINLRS